MTDELKSALKMLSEKYNIEPTKLRIKISMPNKDLKYHIMENGTDIDETNVATALNLNTVKAFGAGIKLNSLFDKLSEKNQINKSNMNVRIFTKSEDFTPEYYLFDNQSPIKKLALEDIN